MPQGDKSACTEKQKCKAEHIEDSYEDKGVSKDVAERPDGRPSTSRMAAATNQALAATTNLVPALVRWIVLTRDCCRLAVHPPL